LLENTELLLTGEVMGLRPTQNNLIGRKVMTVGEPWF
jgi:hypothetical protein